MKEEAFDICEQLLSQKAHFYVCGDVKMADGVCKTLQVVICTFFVIDYDNYHEVAFQLRLLVLNSRYVLTRNYVIGRSNFNLNRMRFLGSDYLSELMICKNYSQSKY